MKRCVLSIILVLCAADIVAGEIPSTRPATQPARVVDLGPPTLVTLSAENSSPEDLVAVLERQIGVHFERNNFTRYSLRQRRKPVTLSLANVTLFDALREALPAMSMSLDPIYGPNPALTTVIIGAPKFEDFDQHPRSNAGPVTFELLSATYVRRSEVSKQRGEPDSPPVPHRFELYMRVFVEPKVRVSRIATFPEYDELVDDRGRSLLLKNYSVSGVYPVDHDGPLATIFTPLNVKAGEGAEKLAHVAGRVQIRRVTASRRTEIELATLTEPREIVAGATRLIVRPMQPDAMSKGVVQIVRVDCVTLEKRLGRYSPWWASDIVAGMVEPYNEVGERMPRPGAQGFGGKPDYEESVNLRFGGQNRLGRIPLPAKLVFDVPTEFDEVLVPFEFRDVPIVEKLERIAAPE